MNAKATCLLIGLTVAVGGCAAHQMLAEPLASFGKSGLINDPKQVGRLEGLWPLAEIGVGQIGGVNGLHRLSGGRS